MTGKSWGVTQIQLLTLPLLGPIYQWDNETDPSSEGNGNRDLNAPVTLRMKEQQGKP